MRMNPILVPFLGMLFLTLAVWFYMYYQRLTAIRRANIDPQSLAVPEGANVLPPRAVNPSNNPLIIPTQ